MNMSVRRLKELIREMYFGLATGAVSEFEGGGTLEGGQEGGQEGERLRHLSVRRLKELIREMYASKARSDRKSFGCEKLERPRTNRRREGIIYPA
eukprot:1187444-Prorocentrum_minimum.AAC.1